MPVDTTVTIRQNDDQITLTPTDVDAARTALESERVASNLHKHYSAAQTDQQGGMMFRAVLGLHMRSQARIRLGMFDVVTPVPQPSQGHLVEVSDSGGRFTDATRRFASATRLIDDP